MTESRLAQQARIRRSTTVAQRQMDQLDAEALQRLQTIYQQAADEITQSLRLAAGADDNIELTQLQDVLSQVNARLKQLGDARDLLLQQGMQQAATLGLSPYTAATGEVVPLLNTLAAQRIADEALRFIVTFIGGDGLQLSDRIWRLDRHARDIVINAIEQAVIQGYGAGQAARELLLQGKPVPLDLQAKIDAANASRISQTIINQLMTGNGSPLDHAMRLMRTELNRAHGEAYMRGGEDHPDFAGWRFLLSPAHPKYDICDLHAAANLHGIGRGVYPSREKCPWPAHPNTLSYVEIVFRNEVTDADRAGKETPMQALDRLTPAQQRGVLGKHKYDVFKSGGLTQGMIKAPLRSVRKRIGQQPPEPPRPRPSKRLDVDDMISRGEPIVTELIESSRRGDGSVDGGKLLESLHTRLSDARPINTPAKVQNGGKGAELVKAASRLFPDDWTKTADRLGPLWAKYSASRGGQVTLPADVAGQHYRGLLGFSGVARGGDGFVRGGSFATMVHEYTHRLQHALPSLDDFFQELHGRRTKGDPLRRMRDLYPHHGYAKSEVTREDKYRNPYQGKEYSGHYYLGRHGALEVMTMAFEDVLGGQAWRLEELVGKDREMLNLVIGLLFHYVP